MVRLRFASVCVHSRTLSSRTKCTHSPLFVTWEKEAGSSSGSGGKASGGKQHHLRGCIGTLSPRSLASLKDYVYSR